MYSPKTCGIITSLVGEEKFRRDTCGLGVEISHGVFA